MRGNWKNILERVERLNLSSRIYSSRYTLEEGSYFKDHIDRRNSASLSAICVFVTCQNYDCAKRNAHVPERDIGVCSGVPDRVSVSLACEAAAPFPR